MTTIDAVAKPMTAMHSAEEKLGAFAGVVERALEATLPRAGQPSLQPFGAARLVESMVSVREDGQRSERVHLGLGLYIVRLIAEAHRGTVHADNRGDGSGVVVTVALPLPTG